MIAQGPALAATGDLDPSFDRNGKRTLPRGAAEAMALQADDKILLAGTILTPREDFRIARLRPDGALDNGFGQRGRVRVPFDALDVLVRDVAVEADGKIVVVGRVSREFAAARLLPTGRSTRASTRTGA